MSEIPERSEEQQVSLEGETTVEEAGTALKNGKGPGILVDNLFNVFGGRWEILSSEL